MDDILVVVFIIFLLIYVCNRKQTLMDKGEKSGMIYAYVGGKDKFPSFLTWKKHIPETDAVEYTDVRQLYTQGHLDQKTVLERL